MSQKFFGKMIVLGCVALSAQSAAAQGFHAGYTDIGPTIGIGGINGASLAIGGRFEHGFKQLPDLGNGTLGIMISADYYSYDAFGGYSLKYIPIGATVNYHFNLDEKKFDPFLGVGLGYYVHSCSGCPGNFGYASSIYFIGRAGARYFFNPKFAAYADVGAGAATLNVGLMFKLN